VGPWFPLAYSGRAHRRDSGAVPPHAFTLAAGLLFGPALGIAIAVVASTASALIALLFGTRGRMAADPPGAARGTP